MATSSVLSNVNISNRKLANSFLSAIESSKTAKPKNVEYSQKCVELKGEDIKKLFKENK